MMSRNAPPFARLIAAWMTKTYAKPKKNCTLKKIGCTPTDKRYLTDIERGCSCWGSLFCVGGRIYSERYVDNTKLRPGQASPRHSGQRKMGPYQPRKPDCENAQLAGLYRLKKWPIFPNKNCFGEGCPYPVPSIYG
jgi:hypothetical protein